jgi:large conductance mechanosensitive channel
VNRLQRPAPAPAPPGPPTTKDCTYCKTAIPIGAVRCPHCTSELRAA